MAQKALFISEQVLIDNSILNENISYTQIRPTIIKCQDMYIQPILGSDLFNDLATKIIAGTITGNNQILLEDKIQPALIQWIQYELPNVLAFKYMNKNMVRRNSTESQSMNMDELKYFMDKTKNDAEWYSERITKYLQENDDLFPLFQNPSTNIDTILPAGSNYQTGMVLQRRRTYDPFGYPENRKDLT